MHRRIRITLMLICSLTLAVSQGWAADYFTELEIDQIRETQDVERRIELFLRIGLIRLGHLGLTEDFDDLDSQQDEGAVSRILLKVLQPGAATDDIGQGTEPTEDFDNDLTQFTEADLLRGYYQALEEAMDNIDDVYERRRGSVRKPLESLKEFTEETIPMLERYAPGTEEERSALDDAIEQAQLALEGADEALEIIPKTEQK